MLDFERALAVARAGAPGPELGLFGPASTIWRVDREAAVFLGAGRALLLQLAHPWVAAGIAEHSTTLADPVGRFHRTFDLMFTMVFGSLDQALGSARRLHGRHAAVTGALPESAGRFVAGSSYRANEPEALAWVHATLVETALMAHDLVLPPLSGMERERYYAETRVLAGLFGLQPESLPCDWRAFTAYTQAMANSDTLSVTPAARHIAGQVLAGVGTPLRSPRWYRALTAELMPPRLRAEFGLAFGEREGRDARRARTWLRRTYPRLPERLRTVGPYQEAMARLSGRPPDLATRALNKLWIGRTRLG